MTSALATEAAITAAPAASVSVPAVAVGPQAHIEWPRRYEVGDVDRLAVIGRLPDDHIPVVVVELLPADERDKDPTSGAGIEPTLVLDVFAVVTNHLAGDLEDVPRVVAKPNSGVP